MDHLLKMTEQDMEWNLNHSITSVLPNIYTKMKKRNTHKQKDMLIKILKTVSCLLVLLGVMGLYHLCF